MIRICLLFLCFGCTTVPPSRKWIVESEDPNALKWSRKKITLDTPRGVTLWWKEELKGDYEIEYTRTIILDSGKNDRLSDLNQFWCADAYPFTRSGVFESYDSTRMYYVGMGGNYNTTSRFRRYDGLGQKPLLQESNIRLIPNHSYKVLTRKKGALVEFYLDQELVFSFEDPQPLSDGYFGIRTTWSRQEIKDFKIRSIP